MPDPRYTKEEHARRGREVYEQQVRAQVEAGNHGKVVAIDIETGVFAVADDGLTAAQQLLARDPDAQIWCERIGHRAVHRFARLTEDQKAELDRRLAALDENPADVVTWQSFVEHVRRKR